MEKSKIKIPPESNNNSKSDTLNTNITGNTLDTTENRNNIEDRKENTKLRFQSTSKIINRSSVSNTSKNITCNNISYKNKGINTVKKKVKFKANLCEIVEIESFKSYLLNNQSNEREKINCRCMIF